MCAASGIQLKLILVASRPVEWNHTGNNKRHSDFRFDVRQKLGNPRRCDGIPINDRGVAGCKISIQPQRRSRELNNPTNDECLLHALAVCLNSWPAS